MLFNFPDNRRSYDDRVGALRPSLARLPRIADSESDRDPQIGDAPDAL